LCGYPDQALKRSTEALALAQGLSHPFSRAYALCAVAQVELLRRGKATAVDKYTETLKALAVEQEFPYWLAAANILKGWVLTEQGHGEKGIEHIRQGLATWRSIGVELGITWFHAVLVESFKKEGRIEDGMAFLSFTLETMRNNEERLYEAELYRLKGELMLAQSSVQRLASSVQKEAEECFLKAIEIAQKQQAKSLELRASTSLARLWQQQGKKSEAHNLLSDVYKWFTEGFDTKDLQDAKALLEELSH
jgi:predicted ATPase